MGYAIAKRAAYRGACVTLVSGKTNIDKPMLVKCIDVKSANDMYNAVEENYKQQDIIIKTAAVADYTPVVTLDSKMKKKDEDLSLDLTRTKDILGYIGSNRGNNQFICGFSMETENLIDNSMAKLKKKNVDMIVANNLNDKGAGFATDTNKVTIITKSGAKDIELMTKEQLADVILDNINDEINKGAHIGE